MLIFDFSKLVGKIKEQYKNRYEFCDKINLSANSLSKKLNNKVPFTSPEIYKMVEVLGIDVKDIHLYFYTLKVEKIQQN